MNSHPIPVLATLVIASAGLALCGGCGTQVGIIASPSEIYVEVDGSATVNVLAVMDRGSPTAVDTPLVITSSDDAIVAVSDQAVAGVAEGTAVLTITDGVFSTTAQVYVVPAGTLPTDLVVTPTSISCQPDSEDTQLQVFAVLSTGASEDFTEQASYSSSATGVALVTTEGVVVCVSEGQAVITAQYLGVSEEVNVVVSPLPPRSIDFSSSTLTCTAGESRLVQVSALWEDGSTTDVSLTAGYFSTNAAVASASLGQVQCLSEGSATIRAEVSGVSSLLQVTVQPAAGGSDELVALHMNPSSIDCRAAQVAYVAVIAELGDGTTVDVTSSPEIQYQTSDSTVALIYQGQVLCSDQGQATLQATLGQFAATATVTVR